MSTLEKIKLFIFFLLMCVSLNIWGSSRTFCFEKTTSLDAVMRDLSFISLPKDELVPSREDHCVNANLNDSRFSLYSQFLRRKYRMVKRKASTQGRSNDDGVSKNCKMELIRKEQGGKKGKDYSFGSKNRLNHSESSQSGTLTSKLLLGNGKTGNIRVNDDFVALTCHVGKDGFFGVDISLVGAISSLMSSLSMRTGEKKDIGSVVEDLKNKNKELSTSGISYQKEKGKRKYHYFLIMR